MHYNYVKERVVIVTIGERIRQRRDELGISQEELAIKLGYKSRSSINKIELGQQGLKQSKIAAIAKALETTPSFIMGWKDGETNVVGSFDNILPIEKKKIPLLGDIACGKPMFANEDRESYVIAGTDINADFCLRAHGDSMIGARILDGDIVFIKKADIVNNGEIAAVIIGDEATLKRVYYYPEKGKLVLNAENPKYEPLVYVGEELNEIHILGKAIAFQSDVI